MVIVHQAGRGLLHDSFDTGSLFLVQGWRNGNTGQTCQVPEGWPGYRRLQLLLGQHPTMAKTTTSPKTPKIMRMANSPSCSGNVRSDGVVVVCGMRKGNHPHCQCRRQSA